MKWKYNISKFMAQSKSSSMWKVYTNKRLPQETEIRVEISEIGRFTKRDDSASEKEK